MRLFRTLFALAIVAIVGGAAVLNWHFPKWTALWTIAAIVLFITLPSTLGAIVDPLGARAIRIYLEKLGASNIDVRPYPNHYGVRFSADGARHYARCLVVKRGIFKWKGPSPEELLSGGTGERLEGRR